MEGSRATRHHRESSGAKVIRVYYSLEVHHAFSSPSSRPFVLGKSVQLPKRAASNVSTSLSHEERR